MFGHDVDKHSEFPRQILARGPFGTERALVRDEVPQERSFRDLKSNREGRHASQSDAKFGGETSGSAVLDAAVTGPTMSTPSADLANGQR
jgi:hypothetical protein